jgi:glycerol-3-phosphate dehydrogenase
MAREALKAVRRHLGPIPFDPDVPVLDPLPPEAEALLANTHLPASQCLRLLARYGVPAAMSFCARGEEMDPIAGSPYVWAELRQTARAEGVVHLDDLLLRRLRLGLLLPNGGMHLMDRIRSVVQAELGWEDLRWEAESAAYRNLWESSYRI